MNEILQKAMLALQKGASKADVDAWVARETNGQFTSLEELQKQGQGSGESAGDFARGLAGTAAQGALMGWGDEAVRATMGDEAGDNFDAQLKAFRERHKVLAPIAELGGGIASGLMLPIGRAGAGIANMLKTGLAVGGLTGAASGAGYAEEGQKGRAALVGGGLGAGLGVALPAAGGTAGWIKNKVGMMVNPDKAALKIALREIDQAVTSGGMSVDDALAKLAELERYAPGQVTVADLNPQTRRLLGSSMRQSPGVQEMAESQLEQRGVEQAGRIGQKVEQIAGAPDVDAMTALEKLRNRLYNEVAPPLFDDIRWTPETLTAYQNFVAEHGPVIKNAASSARAAEMVGGLIDEFPTVRNAQIVRDVLGNAQSKGGVVAPQYKAALERLNSILDDVPRYRDAAKIYRKESSVIRAMEAGQEALKTSVKPRDIQRELATAYREGGARGRDAYRYGLLDGIMSDLRSIAVNRDAARKWQFRSADLDSKLRVAFPDEKEFEAFLKMIGSEFELEKLQRVAGGSPTAAALSDAARMGEDAAMYGAAQIAAGGLRGGPGGAMAGAGWAGAHAIDNLPKMLAPRVASEIGPRMLASGQDAVGVISGITNRAQSRLQRMQKLLTALKGGAALGGQFGGVFGSESR